jgi:hypothetical protein
MNSTSATTIFAPGLPPLPANTDPREELIVLHTISKGIFQPNFVITIKGRCYDLAGNDAGSWEGVDAPVGPQALDQALTAPPQPKPPFNEPVGPVDKVEVQSWSKGIWRHPDGYSTLEWLGPAAIRVVKYAVNIKAQLWISGNQIIVRGTGKFDGYRGLRTVGGSALAPDFRNLTAKGEFDARTVEVFRLVPKKFQGKPPGAP